MVQRSRGALSGKTRKLRGKGRASVSQLVRTFRKGDMVIITPKAHRAGLPHLRYANRNGIVVEKRGESYVVEVGDYNTTKKIVVGPVHLKLAS